jgi:hypothetical protein
MSLLDKKLQYVSALLSRLQEDGFDIAEILSDQDPRQDPSISHMAYLVACYYFDSSCGPLADPDDPIAEAERNKKFEEASNAWMDLAARLGSYDACLKILHTRKNAVEQTIALGLAFEIAEQALKATQDPEEAAGQVERMAELITCSAAYGLGKNMTLFARALQVVADHDLAPSKNSILKAYRGKDEDRGRVQVIGEVTPSTDRGIREQLALYTRLAEHGATLARIGNLREVSRLLDLEFPWFSRVTSWIVAQLAARQHGDHVVRWAPALLVGPPGVGKTSYCQRLAVLLGAPYRLLSVAGSHDNRALAGTARGWGSAGPSLIISTIRETGVANPVFLIDEIDKSGGSDHNGRIVDTLLTLLEPASASNFYDEFLWTSCNLSHVNYIFTANNYRGLPETLLSRFKILEVGAPAKADYPAIVESAKSAYLTRASIDPQWTRPFDAEEQAWLARHFKSPRMTRRAVEVLLDRQLSHPSGMLN